MPAATERDLDRELAQGFHLDPNNCNGAQKRVSGGLRKSISIQSTEDWASIAKIFEGKSVQTCKFQYKSIANQKATPWDEEQDELLRAII